MVYLLGAWLFLESLSDGESSCAFLCFLFVAVFVFLWLFLIFSNISVNERNIYSGTGLNRPFMSLWRCVNSIVNAPTNSAKHKNKNQYGIPVPKRQTI
jgi:hypothetical protein